MLNRCAIQSFVTPVLFLSKTATSNFARSPFLMPSRSFLSLETPTAASAPTASRSASASLGTGKTADGLDALRWWQEHKKSGEFAPLRKIAEYCAFDVKVTKCVHEYALEHGLLKYDDKSGRIADVAVAW